MLQMMLPDTVSRLVVYVEPFNMRWGPDRIRAFCRDEIGIDPDETTGFVFTNRKQDLLLAYFVREDGDAVLQRKLDKGAFLLPAAGPEGKKWVEMKATMLERLFRA